MSNRLSGRNRAAARILHVHVARVSKKRTSHLAGNAVPQHRLVII